MNFPDEFVAPDYNGGSIANVPGTVAAMLGAPFRGLPPLADAIWPTAGPARRVVLLVLDALGWNLVEQERASMAPLLAEATAVSSLTSIFPSTTVAALSSLWTGVAPVQHGLLGLNLFLQEYGTITQFIALSPAFGKYPDALVTAGLEPQQFLDWPGVAEQLAAADIPTHAFRGWDITGSALSRMHGRGDAIEHGAASFGDMLQQVRGLLEDQLGVSMFINAYWPAIDTLSHLYGWSHEVVAAELHTLSQQIQRELLESLSPAARRDTVLLIVADHGQMIAPSEQHHFLEDYPRLRNMILMTPSGEPRALYLFAKQGARAELVTGLNETLGDVLVAWTAEEALAAGLFGPPPHPATAVARLGDVVVAMRDGHTLFDSRRFDQRRATRFLGRHGSLTNSEMLATLIGFRLG